MYSPLPALFLALLHLSVLIKSAAAQQSTYWLANKPHVGKVTFQDPNYPVFRNVKDYGAVGDGLHDDTDAINRAIAAPGTRCGGGNATYGSFCQSSTVTPGLVYFPPGIYNVSKPLIMYYFTQMVGDAVNPPTIRVSSNFTNIVGLAVFDADIYIPSGSGAEWYANQNNFYRQIRNFIIDMTSAPLKTAGIHWQVAQATSMQNIVINMVSKDVVNNQQQGIYMENGSGGFFSDMVITGGAIGAYLGNQQFTTRKIQFDGCSTAIKMNFDWVWLFTQITITNSDVGIDMTSGGFSNLAVGSLVLLDSTISATQGILTPYAPGFSSPQAAGTLVIERVDFTGSGVAISAAGGTQARTILAGQQFVELWAQGNAWTTAGRALNGQYFNGTTCSYQNASQTAYTAQETTIQRALAPIPRPSSLVDSNGQYVYRVKPQYENLQWDTGFLSAKANGLVGDGSTDDTVAMQALFNLAHITGKIVYFDRGAYIVTSTVNVPADVKITGELLSIVMATGPLFGDEFNPKPMWKIGNPGEVGTVEISDLMFEVKGPCPGAIIIEWNIKAAGPALAGMWDAHWRIGGSAGTDLQQDICLKTPATPIAGTNPVLTKCIGAFLLLHVTSQADGYFENTWGWVADHELDMADRQQIYIFNKGGFLIESQGPVWLYGTAAEHSVMYDYQFVNAKDVFMGHIQHETAYFQGNPNALVPFTPQPSWHDPDFSDCVQANCARTWAVRFVNSSSIFMYGGGLYNFFENWNTQACLGTESCQERMVDFRNSTDIYLWALSTKGSQFMISYEGSDLVPYSVNKANFCETIALFELASEQ
ncbi:hypothetical protein AYO21_08717 [Fonsecaea monophora]|uniref:Rhamnogalacturonase A/B/Epimerase-like pectate lyase domain-containing protein n=1 Tax=Fonsecaea monophora TaxID=254056 RepID=A0A177F1I4_9EURO|nr:hypothetical protein AYO21_08717 [Fonsecaea monophora]KAH0848955.1 Glucan 1,3-beta-glucosidase [Fonsecaea pedrosoi]OAG37069.1 hypothetical protein AYO21_08717 [Fonsecaea monophora]